MKKTKVICAVVIAFLTILALAGIAVFREVFGYTGKIVCWYGNEEKNYVVNDLDSGDTLSLSAAEYSKLCGDIACGLQVNDSQITYSFYKDGACILDFSTSQYAYGQARLIGDAVYYVAAESRGKVESFSLWRYRDNEAEKCLDEPLLWGTPVEFSEDRLLLSTRNREILIFDPETGKTEMLCLGSDPCYVPQENAVWYEDPSSKLSRIDLDSGEITQPGQACFELGPTGYSYKNRAFIFRLADGKGGRLSIYHTDTNRCRELTPIRSFLLGWQKVQIRGWPQDTVLWIP